ncbi:hypothetical protein [Enorma phocaeensis]|uniref:hypothetical protein n=1 Tax=Enorma phocaeensis TaxID=1871019 RepID=UPI0032091F22
MDDQLLNAEERSERDVAEQSGSEALPDKGVESGTFDPEAILAEVERRYEDGTRTKPCTAKLLFEENPDLARYHSVLNVRAREFFGRTLGKELVARGLVDKSVPKRAPQITEQAGLATGMGTGAPGAPVSLGDKKGFGEPPATRPASRKLTLDERRERAITDLKKYYPDGKVARLDADHKKLGERLRELYKELGYSSRQEMIKSFGFEMPDSKGGRPRSLDVEAVLTEIQRRYEDGSRPKPRTTKALFDENPDLSGYYEALNSSARRLFGRPLGKEFAARGLIEKAPAKREPSGEGRAARAKKPAYSAEEILAALNDMEQRLADVPFEEKPTTMAALNRLFPEYEELVAKGRKRGVFSKEILTQRGILRLSDSRLAAEKKRARLSHIRNQELPTLLERYESLAGPSFVDGAQRGELRRDGVLGFDLATMSELRETLIPIENVWPFSVGNRPAVEFTRFGPDSFSEYSGRISVSRNGDGKDDQAETLLIPSYDEFLSAERFAGESPFAKEAGAQADSAFMLAGRPIAVLRYRFVVPLAKETLLYALRALGVPMGL